MSTMIWLGLDVHADSIAVAKYVGSAANGEIWEMPNDPKRIRRRMTELRKEGELPASPLPRSSRRQPAINTSIHSGSQPAGGMLDSTVRRPTT
jgi:hypothetical protein